MVNTFTLERNNKHASHEVEKDKYEHVLCDLNKVQKPKLQFFNKIATVLKSGVSNPRPAGRMRPSDEFCAAREGYFTKYNAL